MPSLQQVLPKTDYPNYLQPLLDVAVIAFKLNTGSPCDGHSAMFESWPGTEEHVRRWFVLDNGKAVAIEEAPDQSPAFVVIDYFNEVNEGQPRLNL
ncbi:MAG: hypothetical protein CBB68_02310 [Rhodospirillaceae bacterium TMED8]|nr:hypothetical protein [Magnetovibrio sp.]OUT52208.1 MAG: hypothetical protein CBB68_02310 [Rhodospirillaceae bacterium TMED8]|tara:strand:+ start:297 stop:584 length:288 start_codon:yes stop_codon:yes gene_type:complete